MSRKGESIDPESRLVTAMGLEKAKMGNDY